jgi:hypothetical protein
MTRQLAIRDDRTCPSVEVLLTKAMKSAELTFRKPAARQNIS